ncbi:glycosyltransferase family 8 protein [Ancylobacter lacus]|uniref:glycosyltransferase family 8 protein n=1 Tax=Ancylobacter lacus TaxID=2579970 RepID=UPI001BCB9311|nr:glycosyltransferase family 8 protein [Ancylobacter lacus]MBS7538065.1 glycosyltransferase family 8 protein [Ancylobacter lacus]
MIVATATDPAYVELTAVLLASLAVHAGPEVEAVYVFCDNVAAADKARMAESWPRGDLCFVDLAADEIERFTRLPVSRHLSRTAYARVLMPAKLPEATGRLLYVDCDTVVNGSLAPLETLDLGGRAVGAVEDAATPERRIARNRKIGLPDSTIYFNSGVLLIDLAAWRAARVAERAFAFVAARPDLPMMDQDALNGALAGDWARLDDTWNRHRPKVGGRYPDPPEVWKAARIIHFIGQEKPNFADCGHPARDVFLRHRRATPYAGRPLRSWLSRKIAKKLNDMKRRLARLRRPRVA